jgi:putative MATE family efflux protein
VAEPTDRQILALAVPALGALVAEPLFLVVDSAIVGRLGTEPLAGLGVAAGVLASALWPFVFLAYGTTATVSRGMGSGQLRAALQSGVDGIWLALGLGVLVAVPVALASRPIVGLFGVDPGVADQAVIYLRWSLIGLPAMLAVMAATGVLRGLQDTRTPLRVAGTGAVVNAVLNLVLVHGVQLGIAGSAIGTVTTQLGMAAAFGVVVVRAAREHRASLRPRPVGLAGVWRGGVPLLVRTVCLRAAFLLTTWVAGRLGAVPLAAHQVVSNLYLLLALALDALAIAAQALTGLALGAGDRAAARRATNRTLAWGAMAGAVLGAVLLLGRTPLAAAFSTDPQVRHAIVVALVVAALAQPLAGYIFVLDGVLIGAGDGRYLAWSAVVQVVAYVPLALAVAAWAPRGATGLAWLWLSLTFGHSLVRAATLGWRARGDAWMVTGARTP